MGIGKNDKAVENTLIALEDTRVQRRIIQMIRDAENQNLIKKQQDHTHINELLQKNQALQNQIDVLTEQLQTKIRAYDTIKKRLELAIQERKEICTENDRKAAQVKKLNETLLQKQKELEKLRQEGFALQEKAEKAVQISSAFEKPLCCYKSYLSLPDSLREKLSNVLPDNEPIRFLVAGCQRETILSFWDYIKPEIEKISDLDRQIVLTILAYFIDQYNSLWNAPVFTLMTDEAGKAFDDRLHLRSSDCSRYSGTIQDVLLPGIWNVNKKSAERKSIVRYGKE